MDRIRQFCPGDAQSCCRLIHDCLEADISYSPSLRRKLLESESPEIMEERSRLFYLAVYESSSKIVGIAGLDLNEIRLMYVDPERRKSGIGRALFNHLAAMTPADFFGEIFVYSLPSAMDFYKTLGFIEKGPVSFRVADETVDTIFMTRPTKPLPR
jgi:N-acetylglutamate synthase-like GNAT family acetyltransferase